MKGFKAILVAVLAPTLAAAGDWPQWLGPKRDNASPEKVEAWKDAPAVEWRWPVGPGYSVPVISGGRVFIHSRVKGKDQEEIFALDAKTGKQIWHDSYGRAPFASVLNTGPQATPAVAGNKVITYGITGVLTAYAADSGKRLWQVDCLKQFKAGVPRFGVCCSPMVVGNRVLVSVGGKGSAIVAFDTENGNVAWQALDEPAGTTSPVLVRRKGSLPDVVFMTTLRLIGVNPLDGNINWEHSLVFQPAGTAPTPLVVGDLLVTTTIDNGTTITRLAEKDEKTTTERVWQNKDIGGYFSTGVAAGDYLYLVTNVLKPIPSASLKCVDLKTGKEMWATKGLGSFNAGVIRTGNDRLLILDDTGTLRLAETNPKEYRELAKSKVCGGTFSAPALADSHLYIRDDKEVLCLKLSD
jgi:outer membrane protein assembly factor BamB